MGVVWLLWLELGFRSKRHEHMGCSIAGITQPGHRIRLSPFLGRSINGILITLSNRHHEHDQASVLNLIDESITAVR